MIETHRIHSKFRDVWSEYERKDISNVCKSLIHLMKIKVKKDSVTDIKRHWSNVTNFIAQWEGSKK